MSTTIEDCRWVLIQILARRDVRALVRWAAGCASDVLPLLSGVARDDAECAIQTAVAWAEGHATAEDCRDAADCIDDTAMALPVTCVYYAASAVAFAAYCAAAAAAAGDGVACDQYADSAADYAALGLGGDVRARHLLDLAAAYGEVASYAAEIAGYAACVADAATDDARNQAASYAAEAAGAARYLLDLATAYGGCREH